MSSALTNRPVCITSQLKGLMSVFLQLFRHRTLEREAKGGVVCLYWLQEVDQEENPGKLSPKVKSPVVVLRKLQSSWLKDVRPPLRVDGANSVGWCIGESGDRGDPGGEKVPDPENEANRPLEDRDMAGCGDGASTLVRRNVPAKLRLYCLR